MAPQVFNKPIAADKCRRQLVKSDPIPRSLVSGPIDGISLTILPSRVIVANRLLETVIEVVLLQQCNVVPRNLLPLSFRNVVINLL